MELQGTNRSSRAPAEAQPNNPVGCVEVLGGNEPRAQALIVAGLELLLVSRPAATGAGGDLYCIHSCGDRTLAKIVLLDVTGHGERSAAIARSVHGLLHQYAADTQPSRLLNLVNRQFSQSAPPGILATSLCAVYDFPRGELRYANGGQPHPLFWSARHKRWTSLGPGWDSPCGVPFGVTERACYEEERVLLHPGDILLLFSDGVPETTSPTGGLLQLEGVSRLAQEYPENMQTGSPVPLAALADAFLKRLRAFHGQAEFQDDLTLLWARRLPEDGLAGASTPGV